jgi:hypothetical protein
MNKWVCLAAGAFALAVGCHGKESRNDAPVDAANPPATDACATDAADKCDALRAQIADLEAQRDQAVQASDWAAAARLSLQVNRATDQLALVSTGRDTDDALASLAQKYDVLNQMLDKDLAARPNGGGSAPASGNPGGSAPGNGEPGGTTPGGSDPGGTTPGGTSPGGDENKPPIPAYVYAPSEVEAVAKVFADFGELYVAETPATPGYEEYRAPQPWAGYWYPVRGDELYKDDSSPLVKLDKAAAAANRQSRAASVEATLHDSHAESWEGECSPWALASVNTPEPVSDVTVNGVTFSPSDQKALLTKVFERMPVTVYGIRYNGDAPTDGTRQDLRPEAFHRMMQIVVGERKSGLVIDTDPGVEVWSKSVFRYRFTIKKDPDKANAYLVDAFPWLTKHREELSDDPTGPSDIAAPRYSYRLYVDPASPRDGKFRVIAGEWLGDALGHHPDTATVAVPGGQPSSVNAGINEQMDIVRQIVGLN